jgi:hypothetical protein
VEPLCAGGAAADAKETPIANETPMTHMVKNRRTRIMDWRGMTSLQLPPDRG